MAKTTIVLVYSGFYLFLNHFFSTYRFSLFIFLLASFSLSHFPFSFVLLLVPLYNFLVQTKSISSLKTLFFLSLSLLGFSCFSFLFLLLYTLELKVPSLLLGWIRYTSFATILEGKNTCFFSFNNGVHN